MPCTGWIWRSQADTDVGWGSVPQLEAGLEAPFRLENLRHPLLVWQEKHDEGPAVVPISVGFCGLRVVAITGPNTGGKTVTLKSIGLAALIAHMSMLLPCSSTVLPWCAPVLADISDEQSLQQSSPPSAVM